MEIEPRFSLVLSGLFLFGIGYNWLIGYLERKRLIEGFVALAVVGGTLVTLAGVAVLDPQAAALSLAAFVASGLPMLLGSVVRYIIARNQEREYERQTAPLAERSKRG